MRPTDILDGHIQGDLGGDKIAMKIDENSIAHIMSVLTDLYSDAEQAVIREYPTNAWDSHVEAGNTDPIEVETPTSLSPYFVVRDYGVGLSLNDVADIFSQYGASTKRETNDQVGMLGLGSKSALTYTSQFVVTAVKNGMVAQIVVRRAEDGTGVMEIVDHSATDKPNGVEVRIPVQYGSEIAAKAEKFFRFWQPGTVLLNGKDPSGFADAEGVKEITDDILVVKHNVLDQDYVVMGNVAYPAGDNLARGIFATSFGNSSHVIAYVGIGEVNFPPSREELAYTAKTKTTIEKIRETIKDTLNEKIISSIDEAATAAEAIQRFEEWKSSVNSQTLPDGLKWNGTEIETHYTKAGISYNPFAGRYGVQRSGTWYYHELTGKDNILVLGYDKSETPSSLEKRKIRTYLDEKNIKYNKIYLFDKEIPGSPWTDGLATHKWEDIKAVRFPKSLSGVRSGSQPILIFGNNGVNGNLQWNVVDELDDNDRVVYLSNAEKDINIQSVKSLQAAAPDIKILKLNANRWNKLTRLFPNAVHFKEAWKQVATDLKAKLTDDEIAAASLDHYDKEFVKMVVAEGLTVDDPIFAEIEKLLTVDTTAVQRYNGLVLPGHRIESKSRIFIDYPILHDASAWSIVRTPERVKQATIYMNAVFAAESQETS